MTFLISSKADGGRDKDVIKVIRQKFKDLGPMTFHEAAVLVLFIICVLLWFFRDPGFISGWAELFGNARNVDDATAVMLIVLLLFAIPSKPTFWCLRSKEALSGMRYRKFIAIIRTIY